MAEPGIPPEMMEELRKKATPAHLAQYVTRDQPDEIRWKPYRHLMHVNRKLVEVCTDERQRFLNVSLSVRHGKSLLISSFLPIWYMGMYPHRNVIIISYNETKAKQWGAFVRDYMTFYGPELFGLTVDGSDASKTEWGLKGHRGRCIAAGIDGSLTGVGGDLIIIDDPIKNRGEASSPGVLESVYEGYNSNIRTRLGKHGTMILTMARWSPKDPAGMVRDLVGMEGVDPWEVMDLPAIAEAPKDAEPTWRDEIGRADGEALCPELRTLEELERIKNNPQMALDWESLYQQRPNPPGGGMFKVDSWRFTPAAPEGLRCVRVWDLAATKGGGDWTVGTKVGVTAENDLYVFPPHRFQEDSAGVKREMLKTAREDGRSVIIGIEQERAGAGKAQVQDLKKMLLGFTVEAMKPEGTKEQRAAPFASQQQSRNVTLIGSPEDPRWKAFVEEHRTFPNGRHDDQVDSASGAVNLLSTGGHATITTPADAGDIDFAAMLSAGVFGERTFSIPVG